MKIYITKISKKLRNLREEKNYTQEELAEKLGISRQSIISVEKGKCLPSLPLALRIADIFELAFDEIFNPNNKIIEKKGGDINMHRSLMPFSPFGDLDRFFDDDEITAPTPSRRGLPFPAINVKQNDKEVIVTADIPGIKEDELQVEVGENFVDISGERKEEIKKEDEGYFHQEVRYGSFARRIPLPTEVATAKVEATIKDGLLKLIMPKLSIAKPKVTKIKVKKA